MRFKFFVCMFILLQMSSVAHADVELGYFISSRNVYVVPGDVSEKIGMDREIFGKEMNGAGRASRFSPYGLELNYLANRESSTAFITKTRFAPIAVQTSPGAAVVNGFDFQVQPALRLRALRDEGHSLEFDAGLALRYFHSDDQSVVSNSNVAGLFLEALARCGKWGAEIETSPLALSFGSHGRWGTQRDTNLLRIRADRFVDEADRLKVFLEYHHLHRTFSGAQYGGTQGLFVSDLAMSLGLNYAL